MLILCFKRANLKTGLAFSRFKIFSLSLSLPPLLTPYFYSCFHRTIAVTLRRNVGVLVVVCFEMATAWQSEKRRSKIKWINNQISPRTFWNAQHWFNFWLMAFCSHRTKIVGQFWSSQKFACHVVMIDKKSCPLKCQIQRHLATMMRLVLTFFQYLIEIATSRQNGSKIYQKIQ